MARFRLCRKCRLLVNGTAWYILVERFTYMYTVVFGSLENMISL